MSKSGKRRAAIALKLSTSLGFKDKLKLGTFVNFTLFDQRKHMPFLYNRSCLKAMLKDKSKVSSTSLHSL